MQMRDYVQSQIHLHDRSFGTEFIEKLEVIYWYVHYVKYVGYDRAAHLYTFFIWMNLLDKIDQNIGKYFNKQKQVKYIHFSVNDFTLRLLSIMLGNFDPKCLAKMMSIKDLKEL